MKLVRLLIVGIVLSLMAGNTSTSVQAQRSLTAWTLIDMHRADQPDIFVQDGDTLRLKEDWQAERLEYVFKWWGLAEPAFDYQIVTKAGNLYQHGNTTIKPELVTNFLHALTNLHQSQFILVGQDHTDDYPSWLIEITGVDGQRIQLFSASTGNPGSAPWNIIYNGRMYAQYDGTLADPLNALFTSPSSDPAASYFPGRNVQGVAFATNGWLGQLNSGFVGLLPIADGFQYEFDATTHALHGRIEGRSSIGSFGHMVIGTITELVKVEVSTSDGKALNCSLKQITSNDPSAAAWEFTCEGIDFVLDQAYDYPITVIFGTDKKETISTEGRLQGIWHDPNAVLMVPLPDALQAALAADPRAADILTDHVPIHAYYLAAIYPADPKMGVIGGEMILLGETTTSMGTLRYTIGTPFAVKDGKLTVWSLSRQPLQKMIKEITELAVTKRILKAIPNITLNMWYTEAYTMPELPNLINAYPRSYGLGVKACGDLPSGFVPDDEPLRAFGFESRWDFWSPNFLLMDGKPVVYNLALYSRSGIIGGETDHKLADSLIPSVLFTETGDTFESIRATYSTYRNDDPQVVFSLPDEVSAAQREQLHNLTDSLLIKMDYELETTWYAPRAILKVTDDGALTLYECDRK